MITSFMHGPLFNIRSGFLIFRILRMRNRKFDQTTVRVCGEMSHFWILCFLITKLVFGDDDFPNSWTSWKVNVEY